jgi:hypothetical protein
LDIPDAEAGTDPDETEQFDDVPDTSVKAPVATPQGAAADDALAGVV